MSVEWRLPGNLAALGAGKWIPSPVLGPTRLTLPSARGGNPFAVAKIHSHPRSQLRYVALTPFLTAPATIAIVKLTLGERWLGMRRWADPCFILTFVISQGLGETSWLSTAEKEKLG